MENLKLNGITLEDMASVPYWSFQVRDLDDMLDNMNPEEVYAILNGLRNHIRYGQEPELNDRFEVVLYRNLVDGITSVASSFIKRRNQGIKNLQARNEKKKNAEDKNGFMSRVQDECKVEYDYLKNNINDDKKRDNLTKNRKSIIRKMKATEEEKNELDKWILSIRTVPNCKIDEDNEDMYNELGVVRREVKPVIEEQPFVFETPAIERVRKLSKYEQVMKEHQIQVIGLKDNYGNPNLSDWNKKQNELFIKSILKDLESDEDKDRFNKELEEIKTANTKKVS